MDTEGLGGCVVDIVHKFWPTHIPVSISFNLSSDVFSTLEHENTGTRIQLAISFPKLLLVRGT